MLKLTLSLISILLISLPSFAAETSSCAICGMQVDAQALFSAQVLQGKHVLQFCDIGDLLLYIGEKSQAAGDARVKDYRTGEWMPAVKAFYVYGPKRFTTPMGWSIAAFSDRNVAGEYGAAEDLSSIMKRVVK